ncbi:hypothetical protein BV20DRAFT_232814 [Pilatotrama ljubarskyi]|nr:hypothetical protein BV20DRAFT_232814 [Pilatotrama ljubarskyi]
MCSSRWSTSSHRPSGVPLPTLRDRYPLSSPIPPVHPFIPLPILSLSCSCLYTWPLVHSVQACSICTQTFANTHHSPVHSCPLGPTHWVRRTNSEARACVGDGGRLKGNGNVDAGDDDSIDAAVRRLQRRAGPARPFERRRRP